MRLVIALLLGLATSALVAVVGCGGSSSAGNACQQVGNAVCAKACSCREGPTCALLEGGLTVDFDSEADCKAFLVTFGCSGGDKTGYRDAAACLPLVQAATCTGTGAEAALSYPTDDACAAVSSQAN